jgi:hypothetical protein
VAGGRAPGHGVRRSSALTPPAAPPATASASSHPVAAPPAARPTATRHDEPAVMLGERMSTERTGNHGLDPGPDEPCEYANGDRDDRSRNVHADAPIVSAADAAICTAPRESSPLRSPSVQASDFHPSGSSATRRARCTEREPVALAREADPDHPQSRATNRNSGAGRQAPAP